MNTCPSHLKLLNFTWTTSETEWSFLIKLNSLKIWVKSQNSIQFRLVRSKCRWLCKEYRLKVETSILCLKNMKRLTQKLALITEWILQCLSVCLTFGFAALKKILSSSASNSLNLRIWKISRQFLSDFWILTQFLSKNLTQWNWLKKKSRISRVVLL
jgi:hypothetical protein